MFTNRLKFSAVFGAVMSAATLTAASVAGAQGVSGKLLLTGGVSTVEGSGGGGLSTWALISGYGTDGQIGANVHTTGVKLRDYSLATSGVAIGLYDRIELSYAQQAFDTKTVLTAISPALKDYRLKQDVFGVKLRVAGDAIYDQDSWMPQIAVGVQFKDNSDGTVIPFLNGALGSNIKNRGTDIYVSASKLFLNQSMLLNGTVRLTKANQYGLLGFGGPNGHRYRPEFEGSVAFLLHRDLAIGAELRTKRGNLRNGALNLSEGVAYDVFVAYAPTKNVSITAAYVDLGQIVGALTNDRRQTGAYLSLQFGF
ncbi:MAG: DUF3034 family protein [Betaproteobacteria bacterium]|nr:MAG: DUF3034 family protein [Betaproteobacteria bacterium]